MKVLLAATNSQMFSGATRCLVDHAQLLQKSGYKVIVTLPFPGDLQQELEKLGIRHYVVHEYHAWYTSELHRDNNFKLKRFLNNKAIFQLCHIIRKEKIDIVHVNALTAYTAAAAAIKTKRKLVWHIREFMEEDLRISFFDMDFTKSLIRKADAIVAISEPVKNKWSKVFDSPITLIPDGLPAEKYYQEIISDKPNPINVLIYGRIVPGKGQLFFFEGVERMLRKQPNLGNVHFYWAGKAEDEIYFNQVNNLISSSYFLKDKVSYLGEVSDVKELLSDKQIVAVCSTMEAFGRVTVESMLSGKLVVGADSAGTAAIIDHSKYGLLYEVGNIDSFAGQLSLAISRYNEFFEIRKSAQIIAKETYSLENNFQSITLLYKKLLGD